MKQTFYFNTGVTFENSPVLYGNQVWRGGTKQIPFECENVPEGAKFEYASNTPTAQKGYVACAIVGGGLVSKYAHFRLKFVK